MKRNLITLITLLAMTSLIAPKALAQDVAKIAHFDEYDGYTQALATHALQDSVGLIWISTWNGLYRYDGNHFENYKGRPGDGLPIERNRIDFICLSDKYNIACKTADKWLSFNPKDQTFAVIPQNEYAALQKQMALYKSSAETKQRISQLPEYKDIEYHILFVDKQGGIWVDSHRGLERVTFRKPPLQTQKFNNSGEELVRGLYIDREQRLWIADKNGYVRIIDKAKNTLFLTPKGTLSSSAVPFGHNVYSILQDQKGNIWIGTKPDGLFLISNNSIKQFTNNRADKWSISDNNVYDIKQTKDGRTVIATYNGGINVVKDDGKGGISFVNCNNLLKQYPKDAMQSRVLAVTDDNVLLIGTNNGLYTCSMKLAYDKMTFYANRRRPDDATSLSNNYISGMLIGQGNDIVIATSGGGVESIDRGNLLSEKIRFKHHSRQQGFLSDMTLTLLEDNDLRLWIVSEASLCSMTQKSTIPIYYRKSLFQGDFTFTEVPPVCLPDGKIVMGTTQGVLSFYPREIEKSQYVPSIITYCDSVIDVMPDNPNLQIQFAALDYNHNEPIIYAYRTDGIDDADEWHYTTNTQINYAALRPGTYRLHLRSTNSDGVWVDNETTITVRRHARFNETPWAWMLYGTLLTLLVGLVVWTYRYIRKLKEEIKSIRLSSKEQMELLGDRIKELLHISEKMEEVQTDEAVLSGEDRAFAEKVEAFIDSNINNSDIEIKHFAMEMGVSRTVLFARIKSIFNTTPNNLIVNRRIEHAKHLLETPNIQIAEVAYSCGFSDPKYFSRAFKKITGMSPTEFKPNKNNRTSADHQAENSEPDQQ